MPTATPPPCHGRAMYLERIHAAVAARASTCRLVDLLNPPGGGAHRRPLFCAVKFRGGRPRIVASEALFAFRCRVAMARFCASFVLNLVIFRMRMFFRGG